MLLILYESPSGSVIVGRLYFATVLAGTVMSGKVVEISGGPLFLFLT